MQFMEIDNELADVINAKIDAEVENIFEKIDDLILSTDKKRR